MGLITVKRKIGYGDVWVHDYGEIKEGETFLMPVEEALQREDWEMIGYIPLPDEPTPEPPTPPKTLKQFMAEKSEVKISSSPKSAPIPKLQEVTDGNTDSSNS